MKRLIQFLIIVVIFGFIYFKSSPNDKNTAVDRILNKDNTTFEFQELTIPYLRNREYKSLIDFDNKKIISNNSLFNSYTTSYVSDNLKINGLLTIPNTDMPEGGFPAIVFVHGYIPPTEYETTEKYVDYVNSLAKSGFIVFKIDLRGHGQSEGEASGAYYSSDYVIDVLNAYNALENLNIINKNRIGIWGHSMAGNVTLRSVAIKKDIPALVIWAGAGYTYSDLISYGIGDNSYRPPENNTERAVKRRRLMEDYGQFDSNSWFWKQVPATNYLPGLNTKIQINHAVDDNVVNVNYSRNLYEILKSNKIYTEYYEYVSGGHNISGQSFNLAMTRTIQFYKDNLK